MNTESERKTEPIDQHEEHTLDDNKTGRNLQKIDPPEIESTPVKLWVNEDNKLKVVLDRKSLADCGGNPFRKIVGTKDSEVAQRIFEAGQMAIQPVLGGSNDPKEVALSSNIVFQSLNDFQPKDVIEARLVTQATVLYEHGISNLSRAETSKMFCHAEYYGKMAIKLLRLHNETIEALSRYRRGGEQKVIVQHVNVNEGGRAVVAGDLAMGGSGVQR